MKDKKTFGSFIKQKRIEKNYSQKELADLLYVTVSAVSKWERGVTYPDITLISDICRILDVTEHELIESSDDSKYRKQENDARKYNKLKKILFWSLNICYIVALLACLIVNLAVNHKLSWFFIVLSSILTAYTFCPTITWIFKKYKKLIFIGSTIISLFLLFLTCSIYTNNYWFLIAIIGVLLGYFIILYPILFSRQKQYLSDDKYNKLSRIFLLTYSLGILILIYLLLIAIYSYHSYYLGLGLAISSGCLAVPILFGILKLFNVNKKVQFGLLMAFVGLFAAYVGYSVIRTVALFNATEKNTYYIKEEYNSIYINVDDYDINIYLSSNQNEVIYKENNKMKLEAIVEDNAIKINEIDDRKFYEKTFDLGYKLNVDLYLSLNNIDSLKIISSTTDINVNSGFTFNNVEISNSTGDIKFKSNVLNDLAIKGSTGRKEIIDSNVAGAIKIITSTGKVKLANVLCKSLDIKGGTSDAYLTNVLVSDNLNLALSTGDVKLEQFDASEIYIETSTGNVKGSILSSKIFITKSSTGKIIVPESTTGGVCKITTSTGDIIISIA